MPCMNTTSAPCPMRSTAMRGAGPTCSVIHSAIGVPFLASARAGRDVIGGAEELPVEPFDPAEQPEGGGAQQRRPGRHRAVDRGHTLRVLDQRALAPLPQRQALFDIVAL